MKNILKAGLLALASVGLIACDEGDSNDPQPTSCDDGYELVGSSCVDVNECLRDTDNCSANAFCTNTEGSFTCTCRDGYEGDGVTCENPNLPCRGVCSDDATCVQDGPFDACVCNDGFEGDGITCADINECGDTVTFARGPGEEDVVDCVTPAICIGRSDYGGPLLNVLFDSLDMDIAGPIGPIGPLFVFFQVPTGTLWYDGSCAQAVEADRWDLIPFVELAFDIHEDELEGVSVCMVLPAQQRYFDVTFTEWTASSTGPIIVPLGGEPGEGERLPELELPEGQGAFAYTRTEYVQLCGEGGVCTNTPGGYTCSCAAGYEPTEDGEGCEDIDECEVGEADCGVDGVCVNGIGSWGCLCGEPVVVVQELGGEQVIDCVSDDLCISRGSSGPLYNTLVDNPGEPSPWPGTNPSGALFQRGDCASASARPERFGAYLSPVFASTSPLSVIDVPGCMLDESTDRLWSFTVLSWSTGVATPPPESPTTLRGFSYTRQAFVAEGACEN